MKTSVMLHRVFLIFCYQSIIMYQVIDSNSSVLIPPTRERNLCLSDNCLSKCCPQGMVYNRIPVKNSVCVTGEDNLLKSKQMVYQGFSAVNNVYLKKTNDILYGVPCRKKHVVNHVFYLQQDGKLLVEVTKGSPTIYGPDQYCIDNFVWEDNRTEISALICFSAPSNQENHYQVSSTCMLISCFFIVLTVAVYAWLPELRNLHGMVLMAYLLSFLVGFTFMASMQIQLINNYMLKDMCTVFTFIIYFSLLAAFFWLNIMCYDIWWTFSGKRSMSRGPSSARARFGYYSIYAFGLPLLLTTLVAALEFGLDNNIHQLLPRIRMQGCFLFGNSKLLYFYGPIVILCVANLVFFTLTALKISEIKKQTQVLNKKDKQRFSLYIKLFLVMGVNWILEVVSSFYPDANYIWKFTDAYNVLVGLIIFIIFVCKVKTLKMIKHRIKDCKDSKSNLGEMRAISSLNFSHWRNGTGGRSSIDTIRTTLGQDFDSKSIRSDRVNNTLHS